jgi:RNA polymerase sigma-70 factor (ECF subfamily)
VAEGDEAAFRVLFEHYQDTVYKVAFKYLKSYALAQEVVQEVFIKFWSRRVEMGTVLSLHAWLYTVARNYIIDYMRTVTVHDEAQKQWADDALPHDNTADYKARTSQYRRLLATAVDGLSDRQKTIYKLAKEEGLSYEEIGVLLALSPLTVKTHMARALQSVRDFLEKHGEVYLVLLLIGFY